MTEKNPMPQAASTSDSCCPGWHKRAVVGGQRKKENNPPAMDVASWVQGEAPDICMTHTPVLHPHRVPQPSTPCADAVPGCCEGQLALCQPAGGSCSQQQPGRGGDTQRGRQSISRQLLPAAAHAHQRRQRPSSCRHQTSPVGSKDGDFSQRPTVIHASSTYRPCTINWTRLQSRQSGSAALKRSCIPTTQQREAFSLC